MFSGWPGGAAADLAEMLQVVQGHIVAGEVEQRIGQHGAMPGRDDEAVTIEPLRVVRVKAQELGIQNIRHVGHAERHAGVAGVGGLHGV